MSTNRHGGQLHLTTSCWVIDLLAHANLGISDFAKGTRLDDEEEASVGDDNLITNLVMMVAVTTTMVMMTRLRTFRFW